MAQAQIAPRRGRRSAWQHVAAFLAALRWRGQQRRELVRLLSQLDTGLASGARV